MNFGYIKNQTTSLASVFWYFKNVIYLNFYLFKILSLPFKDLIQA
ncbi:hypothetical protein Dfer_0986 [Dyadobacter fermentans DSM 18053]|uniref:Uncharacterized protein n=1 Tax=Dyadobacter fermentans (strain ATCC 700827 / DSM 18053 / CIP 107007 / KCTC 52180 / NS114) TaxID=471854 RepID=C6W3D1_DYAFD|nr:hypothetical protein Dfer_0986 [Dyadobacter fermentans DSM 18053]